MQKLSTRPTSKRALGALVGLATALAATAALAREDVRPGAPAPDFTAKDSSGRDVSLARFKGRTVVLEWTNQDCPYVRKHYATGNMQQLQQEAAAQGVIWLTIASSAPGAQGYVDGLAADKLTVDRKAHPAAFVLDPDGKLGRLYGATVTPHMYVIDKSGKLAYMGGIDDKPTANHADAKVARNFVREALTAVTTGEPVKTASARPYGCSIKYSAPKS